MYKESKRMILNGINVHLEMIGLLFIGLTAMSFESILKDCEDEDLKSIS